MPESEVKRSSDYMMYNQVYSNLKTNQDGSIAVYDSVENEYRMLKYGAGVRDASCFAIIEMQGNDSLDFLHRVSTNSIKNLRPNTLTKTIFTNEKGKIIDRVDVINNEKSILLICHSVFKDKLYFWLNKYIIMEDIKVKDESNNYFVYVFYGSQNVSFLKMFFGDSVEHLLVNETGQMELEGRNFILARSENSGIPYFRVIGQAQDKEFFFNYINEYKSAFDFSMVGEDAFNIMRVEEGVPAAPYEINDTVNPYEAGVINDVSFTKGCYIGQEVIARLDTYDKVRKILKGVILEENCDITLPAVLLNSSNEEAGLLTSAAKSVLMKKQIGLAIIRKDSSDTGTQLKIKDKNCTVTVSNLPFEK
jgi:folate-binding protein YgfZ